jgi:hypothetical protein
MKVTGITLLLSLAVSTLGCKFSPMETTSESPPILSDSTDVPSNEILSEEHMTDVHQHEHLTESTLVSGVTYEEEVGTEGTVESDHHRETMRDKRSSRSAVPTAEKFAKLIHLVKTSKLEDCAGRSVCELNCHPEAFGSDGKRVLATLAKLQSSGYIQEPDMEFYVKAGLLGKKAFKTKTCKTSCSKTYPHCPADAKDLIAVASLIRLSN